MKFLRSVALVCGAIVPAVAVLAAGPPALAQAAWTITPGPTSGFGILRDVYAASPASAWAVGSQSGGGTGRRNQLIEHWNGRAWQVAALPAVSQFTTELYSVSGTSANDIWAVGDQETAASGAYIPEVTLIMHWDGTSWTRVPSPNPTAFVNRLVVVAAFALNDVWASGFAEAADGQPFTNFTLHWNGSSWSQVATPDPAMMVAGGSSGSDVWFTGATPWHWNGSSFTQVPGPVSRTVAAYSPTAAWGISQEANGVTTLTRWNGSTWSTVQTLPSNDWLSALAALSATDVWAVGNQTIDANGDQVTLTMRWNGTAWASVPSPNPQPGFLPGLLGAAAAAPATVVAVGQGAGTAGNQTLAMVTSNG